MERLRFAAAVVVPAVFASCASPVAAPRHAPVREARPIRPARPAAEPAAVPEVMLPPSIAPLRLVACSFHSTARVDREDPDGGHKPLLLRFAPGAAPFAEVAVYEAVDIDIGVGRAPLTSARIEVGGVSLEAIVDLAELAVHPARPFVVGGLFAVQEYTHLTWEDGAPEQASISIQLHHVETSADRLRATRPCSDLALGWRWFSAEDRAAEPNGIGSGDLIGDRIPVADAPTTKAAARLLLGTDADRLVDVLAVEGTKTRIRFYGDDALVVGWVSRAAVRPSNGGAARDYFPMDGGVGFGTSGATSHVVCRSRIPLVASLGADKRTVGAVRPGTRLGILERGEAFTTINLDRIPVLAAEGAHLLVRSLDLAACRTLSD